jgi:hypothetical protein
MRSPRSVQRKHTALLCQENGSTAVRRSLLASATSGASMMRRFSATSARTARAGRTIIRRTCGIEHNQQPQEHEVRQKKRRSLPAPIAWAGATFADHQYRRVIARPTRRSSARSPAGRCGRRWLGAEGLPCGASCGPAVIGGRRSPSVSNVTHCGSQHFHYRNFTSGFSHRAEVSCTDIYRTEPNGAWDQMTLPPTSVRSDLIM